MSENEIHPAALSQHELLDQCEMKQTRRSGPGGQRRNKTATAIVLTHRPTGLHAEANESRSQAENRKVALFRLRIQLAISVRKKRLDSGSPSPLWMSRCRGGRISVNPQHDDFPALLSEALDCLAANEMEMSAASGRLACTSSQLTKFLQLEPRAMLWVNTRRADLGLRKLQ